MTQPYQGKPLTVNDLADAIEYFWNAAIGAAHRQQEGFAFAAIMSEGMSAIATRLREIAKDDYDKQVSDILGNFAKKV